MSDSGYIVVIGYCHDSESNLSSLIPDDIIKLCCLYWSQKIKIVIHSNDNFQHLDIANYQLSTFNKLQKIMQSDSFCYFDTNSFRFDDNLLYDGIIGITQREEYVLMFGSRYGWTKKTHLSIALFTSNHTQQGNIEYKPFKSKQQLFPEQIDQFVACGENGIVCYSKGDLYQLKLFDINVTNQTFEYRNYLLTSSESSLWGYANSQLPHLTYLRRQNKIICVHLKETDTRCRYMFPVFDFDSGFDDWDRTYICDFKYEKLFEKAHNSVYISARICEDEYDLNTIYAVFQDGSVLKYDFLKNKWTIIIQQIAMCQSISLKNNFVVWMDNYQVLACGDGKYFGRLHLRHNKLQWQKINVIESN